MSSFEILQGMLHEKYPHPGLSVKVSDRVLYEYFSDAPRGEWLHDHIYKFTYMKLDDWFEHIRRYQPSLFDYSELHDMTIPDGQFVGRMINGMGFHFLYHWTRLEENISFAVIGIVDFI